ncbi:MAG: hypothetical protein RLZZ11_1151, partial [Cyanobacteriota bacterium]
ACPGRPVGERRVRCRQGQAGLHRGANSGAGEQAGGGASVPAVLPCPRASQPLSSRQPRCHGLCRCVGCWQWRSEEGRVAEVLGVPRGRRPVIPAAQEHAGGGQVAGNCSGAWLGCWSRCTVALLVPVHGPGSWSVCWSRGMVGLLVAMHSRAASRGAGPGSWSGCWSRFRVAMHRRVAQSRGMGAVLVPVQGPGAGSGCWSRCVTASDGLGAEPER